jgi:hypothetical protein
MAREVISINVDTWRLKVYSQVSELPVATWELTTKNLYLSKPYLTVLEHTLKESCKLFYLVFYNDQEDLVAFALVQLLKLKDQEKSKAENVCSIKDKIQNHLFKTTEIDVMCCGNAFATGQNCFVFDKELDTGFVFDQLGASLKLLHKNFAPFTETQLLVVKEFWESNNTQQKLLDHNYKRIEIDVNMVMPINENWHIFEDYLQDLVTKFRTKCKSVYNKSQDIKAISLSEIEIERHQLSIQKLYLNVLDKAPVAFGQLNIGSWARLKKELNHQFILTGYFLNDQLIGFSTAFLLEDTLEANYVGMNYTYNQSHAVYQRMLYDYVSLAIDKKVRYLSFGRTAEEIKSTVGASAKGMVLYVRHKNGLTNKLLSPIFSAIAPNLYECRQPFKAAYYEKMSLAASLTKIF